MAAFAIAFARSAGFASPAVDVITPDSEEGESELEFANAGNRNDEGSYEVALEITLRHRSTTGSH